MAFFKKSTRSCILSLWVLHLGVGGVCAQAEELSIGAAQGEKPTAKIPGVAGEGKTLPKRVVRARIINRNYQGSSGFDQDGNQRNLGITHRAKVNAYVIEVGITDRLSFQLLMPQVYSNSMSFEEEQFKKSDIFREHYEKSRKLVFKKLQEKNLCATDEGCREFIESNGRLSFPMEITLDTGEKALLEENTPFRVALENAVVNAARPATEGRKGRGDFEAGLLYGLHSSDSLQISTGLGLRFPTAKYEYTEASLPIGSGLVDAGLRYNLDYSPANGLWLSWQQQMEYALTKARWQRPSLRDNQEFNSADPENGGDGLPNERRLRKVGVQFESMVKANYGLGAVAPQLLPVSINTSITAKHERRVVVDDEETAARSAGYYYNLGAQLSGLPYKIPVELSANWATPFAGKNKKVVDSFSEISLKFYTLL